MAKKAEGSSNRKSAREEQDYRVEVDFIRDIKKYREVRDLADRLYTENGCVFKNTYLMKRFRQSVVWYIKKAKCMKISFYFFSFISIILPTLATVLNSVGIHEVWVTCAVSVLSGMTAFIVALTSLFKFHGKWIQYRMTAEEMQSELSLFILSANKYSRCSLEKKHKDSCQKDQPFSDEDLEKMKEEIFAVNIESIMAKEKSQWYSLIKTKNE